MSQIKQIMPAPEGLRAVFISDDVEAPLHLERVVALAVVQQSVGPSWVDVVVLSPTSHNPVVVEASSKTYLGVAWADDEAALAELGLKAAEFQRHRKSKG